MVRSDEKRWENWPIPRMLFFSALWWTVLRKFAWNEWKTRAVGSAAVSQKLMTNFWFVKEIKFQLFGKWREHSRHGPDYCYARWQKQSRHHKKTEVRKPSKELRLYSTKTDRVTIGKRRKERGVSEQISRPKETLSGEAKEEANSYQTQSVIVCSFSVQSFYLHRTVQIKRSL